MALWTVHSTANRGRFSANATHSQIQADSLHPIPADLKLSQRSYIVLRAFWHGHVVTSYGEAAKLPEEGLLRTFQSKSDAQPGCSGIFLITDDPGQHRRCQSC